MDNKEIITTGTMSVTSRTVTKIKKTSKGWIIYGKSWYEFGLFHPWRIGPLKTLKRLGKELLEINNDNESLRVEQDGLNNT